jgi:hypothetical protein
LPTPINEILNAIGRVDSVADLNLVVDTVALRREQLAVKLAASLRVGDRIRIDRIAPSDLEGVTGVVAAPPTAKRLQFRPDNEFSVKARYVQHDGTVHVPTGVVELIERADEAQTSGGETAGDAPAQPGS